LRFQPDSALSLWFEERTGGARGRIREITIVALARKLLVALWRYVETGEIPAGARLTAA
jgi:transposase